MMENADKYFAEASQAWFGYMNNQACDHAAWAALSLAVHLQSAT
jgi:hypothetical protein